MSDQDPKEGEGRKYELIMLRRIMARLDNIASPIHEILILIKENKFYVTAGIFIALGGFLWLSVLPEIGLRDTIQPKFEGDITLYVGELGAGGKYKFSASLRNVGDTIGGAGGILMLRDHEGTPEIIAAAPRLQAVDSMYVTFDTPLTKTLTLDDLPQVLLFCAWQDGGRRRVLSIAARLGREFAIDSAVPGVWEGGKVDYVPWVVIPSAPSGSTLSRRDLCRNEIDAWKKGSVHSCRPLAEGMLPAGCVRS